MKKRVINFFRSDSPLWTKAFYAILKESMKGVSMIKKICSLLIVAGLLSGSISLCSAGAPQSLYPQEYTKKEKKELIKKVMIIGGVLLVGVGLLVCCRCTKRRNLASKGFECSN